MNSSTTFPRKPCAECGTEYTPRSSHSKYCPECVAKVVRRQTAERVRRYRERTREHKESRRIVGGEHDR